MMTQPDPGLCESCRELKPVAWVDSLGREYCAECLAELPVPAPQRMLGFLMLTIPFHVGDRVECRTAGALYDGIGVIDEVSIDPATFGTPVYPAFHVVIEDKAYDEAPDDRWYMEQQLKLVSSE
jgi:hypothetical protein